MVSYQYHKVKGATQGIHVVLASWVSVRLGVFLKTLFLLHVKVL